jgi:Trk K+ transport system NAD-binding subunit
MAYETTRERMDDKVLAVEQNNKLVEAHKLAGRHILCGDATDYDFWRKINLEKIKIIMLTMKNHRANLLALHGIKAAGFQGPVTAIAQFDDELLELEKAGATAAYNIFSEAGAGYADHVCKTTGLVCKAEFVVSGTEIPDLKNKS